MVAHLLWGQAVGGSNPPSPTMGADLRAAIVAVDQCVMTGTHGGTFLGLEPTGRRVKVRGATCSEFGPDGLVVGDTNYIDVGSLLSQLSPS